MLFASPHARSMRLGDMGVAVRTAGAYRALLAARRALSAGVRQTVRPSCLQRPRMSCRQALRVWPDCTQARISSPQARRHARATDSARAGEQTATTVTTTTAKRERHERMRGPRSNGHAAPCNRQFSKRTRDALAQPTQGQLNAERCARSGAVQGCRLASTANAPALAVRSRSAQLAGDVGSHAAE